jgi:hypothetical protein
MLESYLVQRCDIVTVTRNLYSDYVLGSTACEPCRFRFIPTMRREGHAEVNDSDAMIWLKATTCAVIGSIIKFEGQYYQVERLTKARKLGSTAVEFVKCDLKVTDISIS